MNSRIRRTRLRHQGIPALLALGLALTAPGAATAAPGAIVELADVGDRAIHLASTFTSESLVVTNTSTDGETITSITIDLLDGPAMFPDLVFDPAGTGGDTQAKGLTLDSSTGTVALAAPPAYGSPIDGGFASVTATFPVDVEPDDAPGDFDAGAVARFSFDVDPTSIKGTPPEPVPPAAPVSGAELHGARIAISFSSATGLSGDLVLIPGTNNSSRLVLTDEPPLGQPGLEWASDRRSPAVTFDPSQELLVTGPAGASGVLVVAEGHLNVLDAPGGGFNLSPFEANTAVAIDEVPFTIGPDGRASVAVTLGRTAGPFPLLPLERGVNVITAHLVDGTRTSRVSDPITLKFDPDAERTPPAVVDVFPVEGQTGVPADVHVRVIFSEPLDIWTLGKAGAVALMDHVGASVPATLTLSEPGQVTVIPNAPLTPGARYTVTIDPAVTDAVGNPMGRAVSWSFTVEPARQAATPETPAPAGPTGEPACAAVPARPTPTRAGTPRLTAAQLRIDQRIAQAAIRRAAAVEAWLTAGVVAGDLCGNAFGPGEFAGVTFAGGGTAAPAPAAPRPLVVAPARGSRDRVALTAAQLRVNQRIAQAAIRRVGALTARLDAGLTGGDLADGAIGAGKLWTALVARTATPVAPVPATTTLPARASGPRDRVTLSATQLRINRRIGLEAVRRVNALADRLARGLTGADVRDGSLTVEDLAPGARPEDETLLPQGAQTTAPGDPARPRPVGA